MNPLHSTHRGLLFLLATLFVTLTGCGGSSSTTPPPDDSTGDSASMATKIAVDPLTRLVTGEATVAGFTAGALHIHQGATGVDGPVIIGLEQDSSNANRFEVPDGARLTTDQYAQYLAGNLYFNSHLANGDSVVREQITAKTIDISNFTFDTSTGAIGGYVMTSGFTPTVSHIHTAFAGIDGSVAIELVADTATTGRFDVPGGTTLNTQQLADLNAGKLYINVHSADFPAGHVRAQIIPTGIQVLSVELSGAEEVPPTTTSGSGTGYVTVNNTTGAIEATLKLHNISDATAAHIHDAVAGRNSGFIQGFTGNAGDTTWTISGVTLNQTNLDKLLGGETYINAHAPAPFTGGIVRGQIVPSGVSVVKTTLTLDESVATSVGHNGTSAGSANAVTTVNKNASPVSLKSQLFFSNVTPTAAHVHEGATGATGGVVAGTAYTLDLNAGTGTLDITLSGAQVTLFDSDSLYINLHTATNINGELRGQLIP